MKTILEHARMLSRDRLSLGFNDTFPEMIEKLREELKELEEVPGSADPSYELADCLLVLARMFELLNIDPEKAVEEKMRILRRRYALARTLRESFPEKTHEQLYQMAKGILRNKKLNCLFRHSPGNPCTTCIYEGGIDKPFYSCPQKGKLDNCTLYTPK